MNTPISIPTKVPSVSAYIAAFREIERKITRNQRRMLEAHYTSHCRVTTASDMAIRLGYRDFQGANAQYGRLGSMVSDAMGLGRLGVITLTLMVPPDNFATTEWLWVMRENVAKALERLGWVEKRSLLFYPNGMVGPDLNR